MLWGAIDIPYTNFGQICVNKVKNSETPVQSRAICYQKSSTNVYMIDIDILINNPERDNKKYSRISSKNQEDRQKFG